MSRTVVKLIMQGCFCMHSRRQLGQHCKALASAKAYKRNATHTSSSTSESKDFHVNPGKLTRHMARRLFIGCFAVEWRKRDGQTRWFSHVLPSPVLQGQRRITGEACSKSIGHLDQLRFGKGWPALQRATKWQVVYSEHGLDQRAICPSMR